MKTKLNIRRGSFKWTRFANLNSPQCEGWSLANGFCNRNNESQFQFSFGAYGWTKVRVWARHIEDAFEIAVEWLDDHAPGHLVSHEEFAELCKEAAEELGLERCENEDYDRAIVEHAERDLTIIGHATLKHGQYIAAHECFMSEIAR